MYTDSTGVVYSGMGPDFRVMVRKGQKTAATYKLQYGVSSAPRPFNALLSLPCSTL